MTLDLLLNIGYVLFTIYVIGVAIFIISENRTPQSTFAWLLVLIAFPVVGLLLYIFLGRGSHAFSKETELARQEMGSDLMRDFGELAERQQEYIDRIRQEKPASFRHKILNLVTIDIADGKSLYSIV